MITPAADTILPTTFTWRLGGDPGPSLLKAFPLGDAVRNAVMRAGNAVGLARLPEAFHGGPGRREHRHAYWLSEDRDGDGLIDHVTVHATSGLPRLLVAALAGAGSVWLDRTATWELIPQTLGRPEAGGLLGPARIWRPATAYVTPRHRMTDGGRERAGEDAESQLRREMAERRMPIPVWIQWQDRIHLMRVGLAPTDFVSVAGRQTAPAQALKRAPVMLFANPVTGPLSFGFGSHFGLGLMRPDPQSCACLQD
nr:type I-U CRISPR-associated protein Csb2 [uncultured Rhodopila sp.]